MDSLEHVFQYLITNRSVATKNLDKNKVIESVQVLVNAAENGLHPAFIKKLAVSLVFTDSYDVKIKRKLLFSLIPIEKEFPYEIIPIALSYQATTGAGFRISILHWLAALLEFHILDGENKFIHIGYTLLLHLLRDLSSGPVAAKILYRITRRSDVKSYRVRLLQKFYQKKPACDHIDSILCLYNIYRPDLAPKKKMGRRFPSCPKNLEMMLLKAKDRIEGSGMNVNIGADELWISHRTRRYENIHHDVYPYSRPEITVYAETLEEKKKEKLYVTQYQSLLSMVKDTHNWRKWVWPNSASSLLHRPLAIFLFRPYDIQLKISLTDWLEIALRTEIIQEIGNPPKRRQKQLLEACISLVKNSGGLVPVVYHFIGEYLCQWDRFSHLEEVLQLLSCLPFTAADFFFNCIFVNITGLLERASLSLWCSLVDSFTEMVKTWCLQAAREANDNINSTSWPMLNETSPIEGVFLVTELLSRHFLSATTRFKCSTHILNSVINYYTLVNMFCDELNLPVVLGFPPTFVLAVVLQSDIIATHRVGLLLSKIPTYISRVKMCNTSENFIKNASLQMIKYANISVKLFLDTTCNFGAFSEGWHDLLSPYLEDTFIDHLKGIDNVKGCGSVIQSLHYLFVSLPSFNKYNMKNRDERRSATIEAVRRLSMCGFNGIETCFFAFASKEQNASLL